MEGKSKPTSRYNWARFWSVDLHVHTPGSNDAKSEDFGDERTIIKAAIDAGLDAIAVTDHNTVSWCDRMRDAASDTDLVILPGFELSTSDGHLLGIWEEGTPASHLEDVLVRLGIGREQFGSLEILGAKGMSECARMIIDAGGIAIAAHIDKERGILSQPVQTHVNNLLADSNIAAFEFVKQDTPQKVIAKLADARHPALIQSSDAYDASLSRHSVTGIGVRRTWIKAARPDLCGIRYAFDDPDLRVTFEDRSGTAQHPIIDGVQITGGFLSGVSIDLSPDLNCLLGGTGAGKSLVLEAIRYALDQQVDIVEFKTIYDEVNMRLMNALGDGSEVQVLLSVNGTSYKVRRTFDTHGSAPIVEQEIEGDWVEIDRMPASLISIAAFSQGEILEYARQPVGRVGLVDAHLDLSSIEQRIAAISNDIKENAESLIRARENVDALTEQAARVEPLQEREKELSGLFDPKLVRSQGLWASELGQMNTLSEQITAATFTAPSIPTAAYEKIKKARSKIQANRNLKDGISRCDQ